MSTKVSTDLINLSGNTGGLVWAKGTTAQQPASATAGEMRVDTTTHTTLVYNGTEWKTLKETAFVVPPIPTHFLVIAGGGSGGGAPVGQSGAGAGGAGGFRTSYSTTGGGGSAESTTDISLNTAYTITVGSGAAAVSSDTAGLNGVNSIFSDITATGGGGGGRGGAGTPYNGQIGGSGGGGSAGTSAGGVGGVAGTSPVVQGYAGGNGGFDAYNVSGSAGGGGAGQLGFAGQNGVIGNYGGDGGNGGNGLPSSITGSSVTYAGGGGGVAYDYLGATRGSGGSGGGGDGAPANSSGSTGVSGAFNTGSGGGAGGTTSGSGGSGTVILRYPTADLPYFTTTGTLNTPSTTDTVADTAYPVANTAYYKLDSNANDSSGNGYNGTATDVIYGNGRFNEAANFNGTSSVISLGTSSPLNTFGGAQTISVWVKPSSAEFESIIGYRQELSPYQWNQIERMSNNTIRVLLGNYSGAGQFTFNSVGTITLNQWNHIAVTADSTSAKIYINNGTPETKTGTPTSYSNSEPTFIGGDGTYDTDYFTGQIDQVRIFSSALSAANVTDLYNEHFPTKFTDGSDTALKFTGGTGTITFLDTAPILVDYLVVAGGGSAGVSHVGGGGGGAGGYLTNFGGTAVNLVASTNYSVTVGAGGASVSPGNTNTDTQGISGSNSSIQFPTAINAIGGGGGGAWTNAVGQALNGGSGGGGDQNGIGKGSGTAGQGNDGGDGAGSPQYGGAGGGGAYLAGNNGTTSAGGNGGNGLSNSITGSNITYAGGGGGGTYNGGTPGIGGSGGGGNAAAFNSNGINGTANTGGGGGGNGGRGGTVNNLASGAGGSGVVILRYPNTKTITVGAGLTATTATVGTDSVTTFTAGTGTISFS